MGGGGRGCQRYGHSETSMTSLAKSKTAEVYASWAVVHDGSRNRRHKAAMIMIFLIF